ncbi:LOW QUALITY PROTEIN: MAP7 domain-containing protein 2 [Electrophorus electricus]|uniref:LOW QUALITY PROTEIN: MAP7 domain-containing protein 2 n=1 Tax=Electrophorus electricus TaxID=8005 RepID=UPI0015CFA916|nr:LOW QUALITY PROTEIN: MAP7 domain-containing protein 2 [Electrophorus electricus]
MATVVENPSNDTSKKDKVILAKKRREEREKVQESRVQEVWEKEQRAQRQYERSMEERGRRLEAQRQREEQRRVAVEEKRRRRVEEEKERLEALMRRSVERSPQLEQRPKRWTWGASEGDPKIAPPSPATSAVLTNDPAALTPASQSQTDFMILSDSPDSDLIKSLSAALSHTAERGSPSLHKSPYKASSGQAERAKTSTASSGQLDESLRANPAPETPQTEKAGGERGFTHVFIDSTVKRTEAIITPTKSSTARKNQSTPKRSKSCKSRIQSPCSPGQYPTSPMRHRATTPSADNNRRWDGEEKGGENKAYSTLERKTSKTEKIPKSVSKELGYNGESPVTPTGKAGTADAEEASRLLAERRRLARVQKEQEEKQRLEEERLRAEELQRRQAEERERQEQAAREAEEERQRQEEERRKKEADDRRQKERRFRELQEQLDREREEAFLRVQREAERKQREREQLKLQEEQERLQRKKRIEEIMKRTRKTDTEPKKYEVHTEAGCPVTHLVSASLLGPKDVVRINSLPVRDSESSTFAEVKNYESPASVTTDSPIINPLPLEPKVIAADDLSDGVQSMDVSPVSRDELISIQEYSPVNEGSPNSMRNSQALGGLLDLTSDAPYPKAPVGAALGDCNKNLIPGFSIAAADSALIQSLGPAMDKLSI